MFGKKKTTEKKTSSTRNSSKKTAAKKLQLKRQSLFLRLKHKNLQNISDKNSLQNLSFSILPMKTITIK